MSTMLVTYDASANALYIYLQRGVSVARSVLIDDERAVDLDDSGGVVGIEILSPSSDVDLSDIIDRFDLQSAREELLEAVRDFRPSAAV